MLLLLCVTQEPHLLSGLRQAFPEGALRLKQMDSVQDSLNERCDILLLDLRATEAGVPDRSHTVEAAVRRAPHAIVIMSGLHSNLQRDLEQLGAVILHEPTSTGELVLAINRALRKSGNSGNGN